MSAKTDSVPIDNVNNHHSEFSGSKLEKVTYRGEQADKVIVLIATNSDKKLKSNFKGKSSYIIWMEEPDKKAIKTAYDLARTLKVKDASGKAIAVLEKKVKSVENKYDSQKEWPFRNRNSHFLLYDKRIGII